jgi:hypothetical protein
MRSGTIQHRGWAHQYRNAIDSCPLSLWSSSAQRQPVGRMIRCMIVSNADIHHRRSHTAACHALDHPLLALNPHVSGKSLPPTMTCLMTALLSTTFSGVRRFRLATPVRLAIPRGVQRLPESAPRPNRHHRGRPILWEWAELGYLETQSSALLQNTLADAGFEISRALAASPPRLPPLLAAVHR